MGGGQIKRIQGAVPFQWPLLYVGEQVDLISEVVVTCTATCACVRMCVCVCVCMWVGECVCVCVYVGG